MKRRYKIITTSIALVIVLSAMLVGIYAATSASAAVSANIVWTSTPGIAFTLDAQVVNNEAGNGIGASSTPKSITTQVVNGKTPNDTAGSLAGSLDCDFYDGSADGVNNPSAIVYTYTLTNTASSGGRNIMCNISAPAVAEESGTTSTTHKPKVEHSGTLNGVDLTSAQLTAIVSSSGLLIPAGQVLVFKITLSLKSGDGTYPSADLSITSSFDAGVTFTLT